MTVKIRKKQLKIAIGTTYLQKIEYLKEVLQDIGVEANIIPTKVKSGVSDQPMTEEETFQGSMNRAKEVLKENADADFGLGIEVGYHQNKQKNYEMFCCTTIVDKDNVIQSCFSSRFLLPEFHQNVLKEGKYLGEYVREYKEGLNEPVTNYIRELVRGRKPLIIEATRNTLLTYLERNEY